MVMLRVQQPVGKAWLNMTPLCNASAWQTRRGGPSGTPCGACGDMTKNNAGAHSVWRPGAATVISGVYLTVNMRNDIIVGGAGLTLMA